MLWLVKLGFVLFIILNRLIQMAEKENSNNKFSEDRVHEMVMKKYKTLRNDGILQSLEDIYTKQPMSRIVK